MPFCLRKPLVILIDEYLAQKFFPGRDPNWSEVLDRVTMQVFVREHCTMIAAPVQCDVDEIPKGSHYVLLKRAN
jgi:hypothetical protein